MSWARKSIFFIAEFLFQTSSSCIKTFHGICHETILSDCSSFMFAYVCLCTWVQTKQNISLTLNLQKKINHLIYLILEELLSSLYLLFSMTFLLSLPYEYFSSSLEIVCVIFSHLWSSWPNECSLVLANVFLRCDGVKDRCIFTRQFLHVVSDSMDGAERIRYISNQSKTFMENCLYVVFP